MAEIKINFNTEAKVDFLSRPGIYPGCSRVEVLETHMSWIFLTDSYVYKLKKPVHYDFLDFTTPEARKKFCIEETHINKPMAKDIYLGVVPLTTDGNRLFLDGPGEAIDYLVKMIRLDADNLLDAVLKKGAPKRDKEKVVADLLVNFYLSTPSQDIDSGEYRKMMLDDILHNEVELTRSEFALDRTLIRRLAGEAAGCIEKLNHVFEKRIAEGRIIEGHGDLRPEHICLNPPVIIDRLEFNRDLRILDAAEELTFLLLECEMLGSPGSGMVFLKDYEQKSGDKIPQSLIAFFKIKRALLRARLSIHHLLEEKYRKDEKKWKEKTHKYLMLASREISPRNQS